MKKIILLSALAASVCFSQCKKKKDDPAPAAATTTTTTTTTTTGTNTTGTNTTGTTTSTAPTTPSGSLTVGGVTQSLDVQIYQGSVYAIIGNVTTSGAYKQLEAGWVRETPTTKTIDLSSGDEPYIDFSSATTTYEPISGTAKVTVAGASVTVEFTNAVFHPKDGSGNVTASGKLVGINK